MFERAIYAVDQIDPEIFAAIEQDNRRQEDHIELIASENYTSPAVTRLGTPAMTARGFKEEEARLVGDLVADALDAPQDAGHIAQVRERMATLTNRFRVYR